METAPTTETLLENRIGEIENGRDNMHRAKPSATKKACDETFRANQNARRQNKNSITLKSILSCEKLYLSIVNRGGGGGLKKKKAHLKNFYKHQKETQI
ncbi:MAG: hypothetical protein OXU51_01825, partial [Candidatus Poribacteria bacterium]|nr:hypothetical protein [Candidatus Poribacteria bacterium]